MKALSPSETLRAKAKKYEMLAALFEDEEMVSIAKVLLATSPASKPAQPKFKLTANDDPMRTIPGSPSKSRRGELEQVVLGVLKSASGPLTAKSVTVILEQSKHQFGAKNHTIAVAKVLARLHEKGLADAHKDAKGGVTYTPHLTPKLPIREIA